MIKTKNNYTKETLFIDYKSKEIQSLADEFKNLSSTQEKIEGLYIKIRDNWRYNPYIISLSEEHYKASYIYTKKEAHCIDKAILYIAGLRALEIPSRLRLAKVANHIAVENLTEKLGSNEIAPHGLAEVYFDGKWTKCSPAFNKELCDMYNVEALDFNGTEDAIMQEFNKDHKEFMEYLEDYGSFEDVPLDFIKTTFKENYPKFYDKLSKTGAENIFD